MDWCDWFGKGGSVEQRSNSLVRSTLRPVETFFENHFRGYAAGTTVINNFLKNRAIKLGVDNSKISVLPNGCNIDELWPISRTDAREKLGLAREDFTIGYIGAIFEQDAKLMARAFDKAVQVIPGVKLIITGYCNIDFRPMVKNPESIIVTGRIPYQDINQYLGACDICVLPLKNSGANRGRFPLKLHDYMAVGRPVLATNVGEIGEFVREQKIGWLAEDNPLDIAEQIVSISKLREQRKVVGVHARHLAETKFTWNRMAGKLEDFYRKITAGIENPLAEYVHTSARK
jgi:glycosyltransferase involved in cell wall biosynthesis